MLDHHNQVDENDSRHHNDTSTNDVDDKRRQETTSNDVPVFSSSIDDNDNKDVDVEKVQISPTFYMQLCPTKMICIAYLCLQFGFVIFWQKEIGAKSCS